jgi:eukaryotic-like serine/threonine-protein kinase
MPPSAHDIVAERFRLVRELGRGAMGAVWLAHHQALDIPCAVKFIAEQGAAIRELRLRFEREARAAAQIRSPHVVQILDHGVWQDHPYIAMEYLEGETLGARLAREGRLAPRFVARVVTQVARGLSKAHALGIVHRDLKPENLFLVRDDGGVTVKILDFGIAKSPGAAGANGSQTRTGALVGTPCYMSPEQADGTKPVDFRCDLWSLGVIAYRCIVGQLPFESEALGDLLMKIMHRPIPIPSHAAPDLPEAFDAWWARASERDPARRFQSAGALADALSEALGQRIEPREEEEEEVSRPPASPVGEWQSMSTVTSAGNGMLQATVRLSDSSPGAAEGLAGLDTTLLETSTVEEPPLPRPPRARLYGGIAAALALVIACALWLLVREKPSESPDVGAAASSLPSASALVAPAPPSIATPASPVASEEQPPGASASAPSASAPSAASAVPAELASVSKPAQRGRTSGKPAAKPSVPAAASAPASSAPSSKPDMGF